MYERLNISNIAWTVKTELIDTQAIFELDDDILTVTIIKKN